MEGNDTLDGGTGNDYLSGSAGNDTYLFNLGGAQDMISDGDNAAGNVDTIRFGAGIAASDITFTRSGADLVLGINGTTDQLKILNWGYGDAYRIERVEFADGTVWDAAYLQTQASALLGLPLVGTEDNDFLVGWPGENATFQGMGGDDALLGNDGNDTLDGGIGNDSLYGGAGNDTYLFNLGDGQDTVSDSDSAVANLDTIRFGARIAANDITFTRSGMDLVLGINGTSDQLTICDWGYGNDYRIERLEFADGTAWDTAYLQTLIPAPTLVGTNADDVLSLWAGDVGTLQGLDGNDELTVIDGNNTLDGGVGNDYLKGGLGDDVYVFNPGDGQDEIDDGSDIAGSVDTVRFGAGILPDNITFTFNGEDLVLGINGTTDQLTILNWAYDTYSRIERVEFADGTVWDAAYLQDRAVMPIMGTSSDDQLDASNYLGASGYLLNQNVSIQGLEGNDSLYGDDGNDRLDGGAGDDSLAGGAGNDTLIGGEGNDTYAFNLGDGTDAISDAAISLAGAEVNTLVLGAGITAAMITPVISAAGEVTLDFGNGDSIRINQVGNLSIQNIQLADGNVIAIESLLNAPPVAVADSVIVSEDTAQATIVAADLLANDTDPDTGDVLSIAGFDSITALGNAVSMDAAGNLVFDPSTSSGQGIGNRYQYLAQGQIATDTFNYSITDTAGATSTAQVNMTIAGLNDAPVAAADAAYVREDLNITATGNVLGNDTDIDQGTILSVADAGLRAGSYGSLNLAADGSYSYAVDNASPTVQSLGRAAQVAEHFGYTATDGMVGASSVLDVFLNGANDAPILVAPLADQDFTFDKHFSWQMPEGSFTDIDQGDTLDYAATLADGSALPDWLNFDAATRTFSGETPKEVGFVDVQVTATDSVAATGSTAGSLSASDVFRISVSHGNEGVGNGKDAPPPGHDRNTNDGGGTAPGRPGSKGGNGHPSASAKHPQEQEPHDRSSDAKKHKDDTPQQDTGDSGSQRTDELIRTWFEEESTSERYSSFSTLDRHGAWGGQVDRQVKRNVGRGVSEDVSSEWERMNVQLKKHLEQSGGDDGHFSESGTGSRSFGLFGSGGQQGIPQLGTGNGQQLKALAGLKEGLERLGC
jgi:VCBS repeat-containing protein